MDIIYSRELSASVVAELAMLGSRHVLARTTYHSPADVYIVPRWYGSTRRCDEPSASDRWERVQINADAYPALTAWLADDDRSLARQNQEDDRTEGSREIEDAAREESAVLFGEHVAHWIERGRTRAEAVDLANRWATPADAQRALVTAWRENRRSTRGF